MSQYFWPENFPVINSLSTRLADSGFVVSILTGKPNYPDGVIYKNYRNSPNSYLNYRGVNIYRVPIILRHSASFFQLFMNYLSFVLSGTLLVLFRLIFKKYDYILIYCPSPITSAIPGLILGKLKNIPTFLWVQDLWPDSIEVRLNLVMPLKILLKQIVKKIYNASTIIFGQSSSFVNEIKEIVHDKGKVKLLYNFFHDNNIVESQSSLGATNFESDDKFRILCAGNFGEAQDPAALIELARELKSRRIKATIYLAGSGIRINEICEGIKKYDLLDNLKYIGKFAIQEISELYSASDALLLTLKKDSVLSKTIPSRLQHYMSAGKPILSMADGEASDLIINSNSGFVANSGNINLTINNIEKLLGLEENQRIRLGINAKKFAYSNFTQENILSKLTQEFDSIHKN